MKNYKGCFYEKGVKVAIGIIAAAIAVFLLVFFLWDSPAKFVPSTYGCMADSATGEPLVYYEDIFGRTFVKEEDKWRTYCAVPSFSQNSAEEQYVSFDKLDEAVSARDAL